VPTVQAPCPAMVRAACPMRRVWCCWVPETCRCPARRHHEVFRAVAGWILGYAGPVLRHVVPSTWMRLVRHWHAIRTDICSMYRDVSFRNPQFSPASLRRRLVGTASARHWHGNGTPAAVGSWRVFGFTGNRGRRRHAGGNAFSLRLCPGAGLQTARGQRGNKDPARSRRAPHDLS